MMKKYFTLFVLLGIFGCQKADIVSTETCAYEPNMDYLQHPKADELSALLEKYRKLGLPGIVALVEDDHGIWVGHAGKADIDAGVPFLPCQPSKAASITKMMVAIVAFKMQERGDWSLDDKIQDYISKDIIDRIPHADTVTVRHCLQHTTGFYDIISDSDFYLSVLNNPNRHWKAEELIRFAYDKKGEFTPGSRSGYSNTNTLLVSMAMDAVLGYSHARALREEIWTPLGMGDTYYQSRESLPDHVAQGYYDLYNDGSILNVSNLITGSGNGYGGVFSTVYDLHVFLRALFFEKTLISQESLDQMLVFVNENEKRDIGVGVLRPFLDLPVPPGVGHTGRDLGYSADMFYFPTVNDQIMIFMVNYGTDGDTPLREVFWAFEQEMIELVTD
ncbi:MAG: beta-lactamase family protein [Cryomorphaceae bacterium]|nr:beta-lactamase family protein [Cryomorphaceae bacterium]